MRNFAYWKSDDVPGVIYKIWETNTVVDYAIYTNGGAAVSFDYTSVSTGGGTCVFENDPGPVGGIGSTLLVKACLPADADNFTLNPNPLDGTPVIPPTASLDDCVFNQ